MRSQTAPAPGQSDLKPHLQKIRNIRTNLEMEPDDPTSDVTSWRNSVGQLHRELENQMRTINLLKLEKANHTENKEAEFAEQWFTHTQELGAQIKAIIQIAENFMFIPRSCDYNDWEMILLSLQSEIAKASIEVKDRGPGAMVDKIVKMFKLRDNLLAQVLHVLIHKKIVLWMDLGINQEEYVKGEIIKTLEKIQNFQSQKGYVPTRTEYFHPNLNEDSKNFNLLSILGCVTDQFVSMLRLVENNFKLNATKNRQSPLVESLREEVEAARREANRLEAEVQRLRVDDKVPKNREWVQLNRELEETSSEVEMLRMKAERFRMEKAYAEASNADLQFKLDECQGKLSHQEKEIMPKLEDIQRQQREMLEELRRIKQDADLLPEMFRKEVKMKKRIRDEKLEAEKEREEAVEELNRMKARWQQLENENERKTKISMQAIAARNLLDKYFKESQTSVKELQEKLREQQKVNEQLSQEISEMNNNYEELQAHVFTLNNRINELEDQKKVLIDQLKELGALSKAHYTHRKTDKS